MRRRLRNNALLWTVQRRLALLVAIALGVVLLRVGDARAVGAQAGASIVWEQQADLVPTDPAYEDGLGSSVAIQGSLAFVGAPQKTVGSNRYAGAVYVFARSSSGWTQQQELQPDDAAAYDLFGASVAVSGGALVVGAPTFLGVTGDHTGAAYVFTQNSSGSFVQSAKLVPDDPSNESFFGIRVTVSGGVAAVAAQAPEYESGTGTVYIFTGNGGSWSQTQELTPGSDATIFGFGSSLSLSGTTLAVGSAATAVGSDDCAGSVEIYVNEGSTWTFQTKLGPPESPTQGDDFGLSVALDGDTVVVGAPHECSDAPGSVSVFVRSGTSWSLQQQLAPDSSATDDRFGAATAISGDTAVVGMPRCGQYTDSCVTTQVPYAYAFDRSGTAWTLQQRLVASDVVSGDAFGAAVALQGSTAVAGAPDKTSQSAGDLAGSAYAFQYATADGNPCTTGSSCASGFCADGVCCNTACGAACDVCAQALGAPSNGVCAAAPLSSAGSPSCGPYACDGTHVTCPAACAGDADCASGDYCGADGHCHAVLAAGASCNLAAGATCLVAGCRACATSNCVDGVCCNTACGGACDACSVSSGASADGTCTILPIGSLIPSCAPYACDGQNAACPGECAGDADCASSEYCGADGRCHSQAQQGSACGAADCKSAACHECEGSLQCVDGYCCNDACSGPCEACSTQGHLGHCVPVQGAPLAPRRACGGTGVCGGACDGTNGSACTFPAQGTACQTATCTGNVSQPASACDGTGACVTPGTVSCGSYACDAAQGACYTSCRSDSECAPGSACDTTQGQCAGATNQCSDAYSIKTPNGQISSCNGYRCQAGACLSTCAQPSDCAAGYACAGAACVAAAPQPTAGPSTTASSAPKAPATIAPSDASNGGGCSCHTGAGADRGEPPPGWVALLLVVPVLRRARRGTHGLRAAGAARYARRVRRWLLSSLPAALVASVMGCSPSGLLAHGPEVSPRQEQDDRFLVVGWESTARANLDAFIKNPKGIAVVKRSGGTVTLLPECSIPGTYHYVTATGGEQTEDAATSDELAAKVPVFNAAFGAEVKRGDDLHLRLKTVGIYQVESQANFQSADLVGNARCKDLATDVVRAVVVGAYELHTKDHAVVGFGVGLGGTNLVRYESSTHEADKQADGALDQCDNQDGAPLRKCGALLNIELVPIPDAPARSAGSGQRVTGIAVGAVGLASVAAGAVAGVLALSTYSDAEHACPTHVGCSSSAASSASSATTEAHIANYAIGGGAAALAAGAVLFVSAPRAVPQTGGMRDLALDRSDLRRRLAEREILKCAGPTWLGWRSAPSRGARSSAASRASTPTRRRSRRAPRRNLRAAGARRWCRPRAPMGPVSSSTRRR